MILTVSSPPYVITTLRHHHTVNIQALLFLHIPGTCQSVMVCRILCTFLSHLKSSSLDDPEGEADLMLILCVLIINLSNANDVQNPASENL
ncbi:hypothetical protein GDO81_019967 [Engystomops pustulosus]|uniref:Uncharacterized protein n=1 Tax=Engystomops pustulosus TaxID=76066 RepID=A0AAV6ZP27_ENGPU|nr:hypothetical protein GDO81_019967 [Engystomops pustulosus]